MAKKKRYPSKRKSTKDSYQNFTAMTGRGTGNVHDGSTHNANYITRYHQQLEELYRSSWLIGEIVDATADDMTRKGVTITSKIDPANESILQETFTDLGIMKSINRCLKLSRLYGSCMGLLAIEGHDLSKPLRIDAIGKDSFKGIVPIDRWQLTPSLEVTTSFGTNFGLPEYYTISSNFSGFTNGEQIHHSRLLRFDGCELTLNQKQKDQYWGMSIVERVLDVLMRYDSTSVGAAQLVYKAHLRTYSIDDLRGIIADGGPAYQGLLKHLDMIRLYQTNEGMTLMDKKDEFETHSYSFSGLADVLSHLSLEISGAAQTPMVRLFGQSPSGFNTGDSDLRNYQDRIASRRVNDLTKPTKTIFEICYLSLFEKMLPDGFSFEFESLWQLSGVDKSTIMVNTTTAIRDCFLDGLLTKKQALTELKQYANETGFGSSISDEDIDNAKEEAPEPPDPNSVESDDRPIRKYTTEDSVSSGKGHKWLRWFN